MHIARVGTFRQRTQKAQCTSELLQAQRQMRFAQQTHAAIDNFEELLKTTECKGSLEDDVPDEAGGRMWSSTKGRQFSKASTSSGQGGVSALPADDALSDGALNVSMGSRRLGRATLAGGRQKVLSIVIDKDEHEMRPPSPVGMYNYGCISQRPRSQLGQQRKDRGEPCKPKHRQAGQGFYFPGAQYKQGPYGFSLQDPILVPTMCWAESKPTPLRHGGDAGDLRPASSPDLDQRRNVGKPHLSHSVPSTRGHSRRAERTFAAIDRKREDLFLEHVRFENGVYEGRWRDPCLEDNEEITQQPLAAEFNFFTDDDACVDDPSKRLAAEVAFGLEVTLHANLTKLKQLFAAETHGHSSHPHTAVGVLEPHAFLHGLIRVGVLAPGDASEKDIVQAMFHLDSSFDGRVNLAAIGRAVAAAQACRLQRATEARDAEQKYHERINLRYHDTLPVDIVKVDRNPRSLFDFERSFKKFESQQKELLTLHKEGPE